MIIIVKKILKIFLILIIVFIIIIIIKIRLKLQKIKIYLLILEILLLNYIIKNQKMDIIKIRQILLIN